MTHQNKAREAHDKLNGFVFSDGAAPICAWVNEYRETIRRALTLLERLEGADREALGEAITRLKKGYAQFDTFGTAYAVLYSENNENDLNLIEEAARLVLPLGKQQKIDPLAGTPDGLAGD